MVRWKCEGSDSGGTNDDKIFCEQEVGDCASTLGDCVQGISSDPRGATNPWVCAGTGGGSDETCVFSVCGTADNAAQGCLPNMPSTLPLPNVSAYQDVTGHTWECHGNSRDINCHVGLCDYSGPGLCVNPSTPSGSDYEWTCEGANNSESADDVDCVIGQCKDVNDGGADNNLDGCITGEWDTNAPPGFWHCRGNHPNPNVTTDDDPNCEATGPVDGLCLYHSAGACANNGPSVGTGNAWTCEGRNGGVDAACKIGECGTADDPTPGIGCAVGTHEHVPGDTWNCRGSDDLIETDDYLNCRGPVDPYGECGTADNQFEGCTFGIYDHITGPTWNCLGGDDTIDTDDDNCGPCDTGIPDIRTIGGLGCHSEDLDYCFRQYGEEYKTCTVTASSHQELWGAWDDGTEIYWVIVGDNISGGILTLDCCAGSTPPVCPDGTTGTPPNCISQCEITTDSFGASCNGSFNCWKWITVDGPPTECRMVNYPLTTVWGYYNGHLGAEMASHSGYFTFNYACTSAADPDTCPWPPGTEDPLPYTGRCGTADNEDDGCAIGEYVDTATPGWTCSGVYGGADTSCSIGTCGSTDYTCDVGNVYSQQPGPPPTWICDLDDPFGGVPGVPCTGSVDAVCGTADNAVQGCTDGTWQDETGDGWTCQGVNGGADASCGLFCNNASTYGTPPTNCSGGVCGCCGIWTTSIFDGGNAGQFQCTTGTFEDVDEEADLGCYDPRLGQPPTPGMQPCGPYWHCRGSDNTTDTDDHTYCEITQIF